MAGASRDGDLYIRDYADADAPAVARFWLESADSWPAGFTNGVPIDAERIRAGRRAGSSINLLLAFERGDDGGRLLGYCNLTDALDGDAGAAYVALLNVHPLALGSGVGKLLLRRALDRTIELGRNRLDLHTWPGNVRAVPLYKKMGFYWVPETSVRMENHLPTILRHPLTRSFLGDADWYSCYRRALTQAPDDDKHLDRPAYVYDFERDGRRLRWAIDLASREPFSVESDAFTASLLAPTKLPVGRSASATLRLAGADDRWAAFCRGAAGLGGQRALVGDAARSGDHEIVLTADDIGTRGKVAADVALDGISVSLGAGVEVTPLVSVALEPGEPLLPGRAGRVEITATNETAERLSCVLTFGESIGINVEPGECALDLAPRERVTLALSAKADHGANSLAVGVRSASGRGLVQPIRPVSVVAVRPGGVVAWQDDAGAHVATARLRYSAESGGSVRVIERETGEEIVAPGITVGPPFTPKDPGLHRWSAGAESAGGRARITLNASLERRPLRVTVVHEIGADDVIATTVAVANLGSEEIETNARLAAGLATRPAERAIKTVPLRAGLVSSSWPELPDWTHLGLSPAEYAEGWFAVGTAERTVGFAWTRAQMFDWNWGGPIIELPIGVVPSGMTLATPPALLILGASSWNEVRRRWREALSPDAPARAPEPVGVVDLAARPILSATGRAATAVTLRSFLGRPQDGRLELRARPGWKLDPADFEARGLSVRSPIQLTLHAEPPDSGPAATLAEGTFRSDLGEWPFAVPMIRLGDASAVVSVRTKDAAGARVFEVANGWWSFDVAPTFNGGVVRLERAGIERLDCAFPRPRNRAWSYPWYGGIGVALHAIGNGHGANPGDSASAFRGDPSIEIVNALEDLGAGWSGVRLGGESRRWTGVRVTIDYLTAPGSNCLLVVCRLANASRSRVRGAVDLSAFLAPNGSIGETELHVLDERGEQEIIRRAPYRTFSVGSDRWASACGRGGSEAFALTSLDRGRAYGLDWGRDGGHLGAWSEFDLAPDESIEERALLALAPDVASAKAYRWLASRD